MITQFLRRIGIRADSSDGNKYCRVCGGFLVCRAGCTR
jgi:hypothetical protein